MKTAKPPLIFDLDGTLVDSVYLHVAAFQRAFWQFGAVAPYFEIHRRIGMGSDRLLKSLNEALGLGLDEADLAQIQSLHAAAYAKTRETSTALPGARDIWRILENRGVDFAIASSASPEDAASFLELVGYPPGAPLITGADHASSKPAPGPFELAAQKLGVHLKDSIVVGDSVWDMLASRRAGALGVGVLSGGYAQQELSTAGAFRVYADIRDLGAKLEELGL